MVPKEHLDPSRRCKAIECDETGELDHPSSWKAILANPVHCTLSLEKVYVHCCIALTGLFFVVAGLQIWATDYLNRALGAPKVLAQMAHAELGGGSFCDQLCIRPHARCFV